MDAPVWGPVELATNPRAAYDGRDFLVVWDDQRGAVSGVAAARVTGGGALLDSQSDLIPWATVARRAPAVAFDGTNYLVVWQESAGSSAINDRIRGVRLGKDGSVLGSVFSVSSDSPSENCQAPSIAFDGKNFLVVWHFTQSSYFEIDGARVSPSGVVVDASPAVLVHDQGGASSYFSTPPALVFAGDGYMLGWSEASNILASRVTTALTRLDTPAIQIATGADSYDPALAWDGTHYFVTFSNYDSNASTSAPFSRQLSATGTPLGQAVPLAASASGSYANAAVGADSNGALALYSSGKNDSEDLQGALLDPTTGALTATKALVATTGAQWDPSLAAGGSSSPFVLTWVDTRNAGGAIYASRLGVDRTPLDQTGLLVSYALNKETTPVIAGSTSGFVVAWIDGREGGYQVYGTALDQSGAPSRTTAVAYASGRPRRSNVAIASDGTKHLVVWNENDFSANYPLVGRLVGSDGTPQAAAVTFEPTKLMYQPVVAYGGGVYLAVGVESTSSGWNTWGLRVSPAGQAIDATPFAITTAAFRPAMASDGSNFLVIWKSGNSVMGARVGSNGTVLDTNPFTISPAGSTVLAYPQIAFGGGSYLVVWESVSSPEIVGVRVTPDGKVTDTKPLAIAAETTGSTIEVAAGPTVAFDGTNFQVAWHSTLYTMSLSVLSQDYKVTQIAPDGTVGKSVRAGPSGASQGSFDPAPIAGDSSGHVVMAYTQLDSPAGYAIDRVRLAALSEQKSAAGAACQTTLDCTSGFCADGVCCDGSCTGDVFDCRACSVLAGAAKNGTCGIVADGHACGSRGTCSAGTCTEGRDAGSNTGGGAGRTGMVDGAAGTPATGGSAGGVTSRADASAGSGNNPGGGGAGGAGGGGAAGGLAGVGGSPGGFAGNAGRAGNAGASAGGLATSVRDAGASDGSQATSGSSGDSGCGCRVAAPQRSSPLALVTMFLLSTLASFRRRARPPRSARRSVSWSSSRQRS